MKSCKKDKKDIQDYRAYGIGKRITAFPMKLKALIKQIMPIYMYLIFKKEILVGFKAYKDLLEKYGEDTHILSCAWKGTGDYYICNLYLEEYLKKNNIHNFVFLTPGGAELAVSKLFPKYKDRFICFDEADAARLCHFRIFIFPKSKFIFLHHQAPTYRTLSFSLTRDFLSGFRNLNMVDFYLSSGFGLSEKSKKALPVFNFEENQLKMFFEKHNLKKGRTILLAPYSTGLKKYLPPDAFWETLTKKLTETGYCVCTNCSEKEKPIKNTVPIFLEYEKTVPFLEYGGGFIGIRSGLCDIISSAKCRKIILHTYEAEYWPNGNSIAYTGLNNMGLCEDAVEIEFDNDYEDLISDILKEIQA